MKKIFIPVGGRSDSGKPVVPGLGSVTYSSAVVVEDEAGGMRHIYCSGVTATDNLNEFGGGVGKTVGIDDIGAQAKQVCANLKRVLESAGASVDDIVRVRVYVVGPMTEEMFREVHRVRALFFSPDRYPASTLVVVSGLARPESLIEIDADAVVRVK